MNKPGVKVSASLSTKKLESSQQTVGKEPMYAIKQKKITCFLKTSPLSNLKKKQIDALNALLNFKTTHDWQFFD